MKRKQLIPAVLAGTLIGAALVGPASAGVAALTAAPSNPDLLCGRSKQA